MGKIIVGNMRRMGLKAKIGLVAVFTLFMSVFIYDGLYRAKGLDAAVALGTAWSTIHNAAPGTSLARNGTSTITSSGSYTAGNGANRLLLVAINYEFATAVAAGNAGITATIGGVAVTEIVTTENTTANEHVWLGYVANANIPAGAATVTAVFNKVTAATTLSSIAIKVGTYTNVDQTTPINASNANYAGATTVASNAAVSYALGGKTIIATANGGVTATPAYTATPALTTNSTATSTTGHSTYIAESAAHASAGTYTSGGISVTYTGTTTAYSAVAIAALNPATTTLGNGIAGTNATVAPGSSAQKIDGFSLVTGSAGTTDSVTGLTVTTTNQAAIASMQIWNEAGTTQYFATVNNPGSNTWAFSGGTPIPVTNTAANFKILVTYKTRAAGAPAGSTATTASVTALTSANLVSGTDTADTTLTLSNVHAASTWGTLTPSDRQIALNWTYGTPGQSVIIIRYTDTTDTTKPVDGTTYSAPGAFGTGGTVVYNGAAATYTNSGLTNGTTYYYKIFEYDTYKNYYNATDVWTAGLTPVTSDPTPPTVDAGFEATTPVNTVNVPITVLSASDVGTGVAGYMITTSATPPNAGDASWTPVPPATYTVAGQGSYTLYPWAKDGGGNVSGVYGAPVTVVVDLTKPTVSTFTVTSPTNSLNIPLTGFTAADTGGSNVAAYMVTTSATPPSAGDGGWSGTAPTIFTVGVDGSYTLYPWVKDGAGNVSLAFGAPRTVQVDTTAPTGLAAASPADEAVDQPTNVSISCTTATDAGVGGVMYQFQVTNIDLAYNQTSSWQAGTSYAPTGLLEGYTYTWSVKAKDSLGNETAFTAPRSFTTIIPCTRNAPTVTLLSQTGGIATTIATDGGTYNYNLKVINNDYGSCGNTTFNLSLVDTDDYNQFLDSTLGTTTMTLAPGAQSTTTATVRATPGIISGGERTVAKTAADAFHPQVTTGYVQTTLNVVACTARVPLLIVGPDSGYLNRNGNRTYTVTVKNTDTGAACGPVSYSLAIVSDSNSTDFNPSQLSSGTLLLNAGQLASTTLTVYTKPTAVKNAQNLTFVGVSATAHTSPVNVMVTSTVNNPMLHNSDNTSSTKWSSNSGWGVPGGRYGEFKCTTCHVEGGLDTANAKRGRESVFAPSSTIAQLPGAYKKIEYRRYAGDNSSLPLLGWDAGATPRTESSRICEVCHTYDATGTNGTKAHPYATAATLGNHFNTDGTDCTRCHKHKQGFTMAGIVCTTCHGDSSVTTITADNRYAAAPPKNLNQVSGTLTGTSLVSNDPKVGAHQTHLQFTNGFSNYSTVDFRCASCHGPVPAAGSYAHANGSSAPAFQGLANNRGARSVSFSSANLTCSNTYCHNPAGSGGTLAAANAGTAIFPSWTSASYLSDGGKTDANCNKCHKSPGASGFSFQASHTQNTVVGYDCAGCHGHNGDASGVVGARHIDGIRSAAGGHAMPYGGTVHMPGGTGNPVANAKADYTNCSGCHDTTTPGGSYPATKPLCSACHINTANFLSATPGCYDCHGSSASNGQPNGNAFPNYSGSHSKHVAQGMTCANCHGNYGGGINDATHGSSGGTAHTFAFVNVTSPTSKFHYTTTGKGTCSTNTCHANAEWGVTKLGCNSCHAYDTAGATWLPLLSGGSGAGAHAKHINFIKSRLGIATLTPNGQTFGAGEPQGVCGTCHSNTFSDHTMLTIGSRSINFGGGSNMMGAGYGSSSMSLLFGNSGAPAFSGALKTCSNLSCHYYTTPSWY